MEEFPGRVSLVTGAASGIGRAVAVRLAQGGCDVGLFDRDAAGLEETERLIRGVGRRALGMVGDVVSRSDVTECVGQVARQLGAINILVNNAGILRTAPFLEISESDWRTMFAINVDGAFAFSQAVLPQMLERRSGSIVNMASWTGKRGVPNHSAYGATKAALINLTQSLAAEFGEHGIRVNSVCPGIIVATAMRDSAEQMNREQGLPDVATRVSTMPLRRPGYPHEIAEVVAFLASDRAAYMTGQAINVTGGHWMN